MWAFVGCATFFFKTVKISAMQQTIFYQENQARLQEVAQAQKTL
jgi:hypothetical protein